MKISWTNEERKNLLNPDYIKTLSEKEIEKILKIERRRIHIEMYLEFLSEKKTIFQKICFTFKYWITDYIYFLIYQIKNKTT